MNLSSIDQGVRTSVLGVNINGRGKIRYSYEYDVSAYTVCKYIFLFW